MRKYWLLFKTSIENVLEYRFDFFILRFRGIVLLLTLYYLWDAIYKNREAAFGFDKSQILTYVLGVHLLRSIVLWTKTEYAAGEITEGQLFRYLVKPVSYFKYWMTRELSERLVIVLASIFETVVFVLLVKPSLFVQEDLLTLVLFVISILGASFLYFVLHFLICLTAFWTWQAWGPRFFFMILAEFFAGAFFPLSVFPGPITTFLERLPFSYLVYFPLRIYLGQLPTSAILQGIFWQVVWIGLSLFAFRSVWRRGLRFYAASAD